MDTLCREGRNRYFVQEGKKWILCAGREEIDTLCHKGRNGYFVQEGKKWILFAGREEVDTLCRKGRNRQRAGGSEEIDQSCRRKCRNQSKHTRLKRTLFNQD